LRQVFLAGVILMLGFMMQKSFVLAQSTSDYRPATEFLLSKDPNVKFLSTQPYIQNLYLENKHNVKTCPHRIEYLYQYFNHGYRYVVLCPQAYISWTDDKQRFTPKLEGFLPFMLANFKPIKVYPNFNDALMERFVFDHNENLFTSIRFLALNKEKHFGELKIYELKSIIPMMINLILRQGYDIRKFKIPDDELFKYDNL